VESSSATASIASGAARLLLRLLLLPLLRPARS